MILTTRRRSKPARELQLTARTPPNPMEELSEEMIMEIFLRLPVKTLSCMKSVCRSWRTLISNPDFTLNHFRRSSLRDPTLTPPRIAYDYSIYQPHDDNFCGIGVLSVQSLTKVAHFRGQSYYLIVGSCHGLLCLFDFDGSYALMRAILWNPCTGFTFQSPQIRRYANFCGFGYDHLSDTYKFCGITRKLGPSGFVNIGRIYTFEPNSSWRIIDDIPIDEDISMADNLKGVYFGSSRECTLNWSFFHVVYYFDLGKETYGHFALPDRDSEHYIPCVYTTLCVLRECLCVCYGSSHQISQHWILWQMKEYGNPQSWTKLATIPFNYGNFARSLNKPHIISESDVLLLIIYPGIKVVLYNLNDGSLGDFPAIDGFPDLIEKSSYVNFYIYYESLASPSGLQSNSSKMLLPFIKP
ncbi:hypothetical protein PIB30_033174 [Stylosanthes scabra]|uniref:F-box domain-containing protein n=1 Tax=Stylosanthes scabra TaxID=79078 RepID=A0ABU6Z9D5_9FABA|nr:hypothetical protein [Stylosanthes scabra]